MSDLLWAEVKHFFDVDLYGVLPDVVIEGTGLDDWQALLDLVGSQGWAYEYSQDGEVLDLPPAAEMVAAGGAAVALRVWPVPEVLAVFRPFSAESIDFDVDLRELQGQERLDILCDLFRVIGRRLRKPVLLMPEGVDVHPVLGFDVDSDRVMLLADPDDE
ncbi:hypothetical protein N5079_16435 [Planotetraspora sp. A-T 1434]|uniref:hypothetical protein n=1 Tax=Planotetraspora sp. A-T 1434 TaxID=2979219 RepID=UPI0021BE8407|nr:hypothetical protein [Planotetraspora sp. A-T 1434]MCT9931801.1 hypothetical protein [Planotetraspora sp. A-T 1434]